MMIRETGRTSWRDAPIVRVLGSATSWFLFALNMSLLFLVSSTVMSLGGFCASGGPYVIEVECPENVLAFAPLSIFGGLFSVAVALFLARGFGVPLLIWGWPLLFASLASAFLHSYFVGGDIVGIIIGVLFILMAIAPLWLELRASWQRVLLGTVDATGARFRESDRARTSLLSPGTPNPEGAVEPTGFHWALSLSIAVLAGWGGYTLAQLWFFSA